jgi:hypothetical protein
LAVKILHDETRAMLDVSDARRHHVNAGFVAGVPESEVVFDYAEPFANYSAGRRAVIMAIAARGDPGSVSSTRRNSPRCCVQKDLGPLRISALPN